MFSSNLALEQEAKIKARKIQSSLGFFRPNATIDELIEKALDQPEIISELISGTRAKELRNEHLVKLAQSCPKEFFNNEKLVKSLTDLDLLHIASSNVNVSRVLLDYPNLMDKIEHFYVENDGSIYSFESISIKNVFIVSKLFDRYKELKAEAADINSEDVMIWVP